MFKIKWGVFKFWPVLFFGLQQQTVSEPRIKKLQFTKLFIYIKLKMRIFSVPLYTLLWVVRAQTIILTIGFWN